MPDQPVRLGLTPAERTLVLAAFPVVGALVGALLPFAWRWVEDVGWIPFHGPLTALMSLDAGWQSVLRILILAGVGLVVALATFAEETVVEIGPHEVVVTRDGSSRTLHRDRIAGVFLDGKKLVIETSEGRRLLDAEVEGARSKAGPAFQQFGYPWESD